VNCVKTALLGISNIELLPKFISEVMLPSETKVVLIIIFSAPISSKIVIKKPAKEGLLKLYITVFIVTAFCESQIRQKWSQCDGFCNIKADRHKN
jgi:hypothetical protein